jgi:hypothetical protein
MRRVSPPPRSASKANWQEKATSGLQADAKLNVMFFDG